MAKAKQLILLFILSSGSLFANVTIKGHVTDSNNEPLPGAGIVIKGTTQGTITNANGDYSFLYKQNVEAVTLTVSSMGYKTVEREVSAKQGIIESSFKLEEEISRLNEVVVVAKTEAQILRERALPVNILSMSQIQGTVSSVNDILTKTSGLTIRNSGGVGSSSRISLRGLEGKRIGYFYGGCPMGDRSELASLNDIPVDMIEAIEIYKGVVPAKFGGSAMGGAVNIVFSGKNSKEE